MAIAEKLEYLNGTKQAIKTAIQNRGVNVSDTDTFRDYSTKIGDIGETVDKTKFGVSIDNILGDVGADGNYIAPTAKFSVDLAGLSAVPSNRFYYKFYASSGLQKFIANDVVSVGDFSFYSCCQNSTNLAEFRIDNLELADGDSAFYNCLLGCSNLETISFKSLKRVTGDKCFYGFMVSVAGVQKMDVASIFPALEEITGAQAFNGFMNYNYLPAITFPSLKKITGGASSYAGTFGGVYVADTVWNLPSAMELTGYVWNATASGEIHFAAANQAAIEACDGYANKWGFANATIYFDL